MSFITKRERVFNEYDLFDLPARNEGKLKAYASCTDARAWSHFCADKSEHLVDIIKRNNEMCRPKYIPTDVIVDTIMVAKNAEIARLKHKIEEFEQMLAAYDQLELDSDQKCEIAKAHAAIKAANKELDDLYLDLDMSEYTEGIDSEAFETGKSRGDEPSRYRPDEIPMFKTNEMPFDFKPDYPKMEAVGVQMDLSNICDASTHAEDPRIDEMQDVIIAKDAKLNAMKNTIAVMENDVCEPYCIYAHIYTALEKIFGILCQNDKYKHYLVLLTAGKDTRCIDIKGRILFKLKVLEKFSLALIAPCSQNLDTSSTPQECACYRVEVAPRVETSYALTSAESKLRPILDNKRAQLVADIIENEEMKEILSKESTVISPEEEITDFLTADNYCIDAENLKRLKNLQENYDDLMTCYEALKHEKDCLEIRCHKYEELEKEFMSLKDQMSEYNSLWNEKEHYRKRSADLDKLKEQYLVLTDETLSLETQIKAETEINHIKCKAIDDLRNENILLEKKINDAAITFEKEKNILLCKLKEADCRVMCQGQQVKSLSIQIDKLLEHDHERGPSHDAESYSIALIDEVESLKEQIKNLKDAMLCNEEEKQQLQNEFQDKLALINQLRMEIEDWKSTYEKTIQRNDYLEKYTESFRDEVHRLIEENRLLSQDAEEKSTAVENLINVINNKSHEVKQLMDEIDTKATENKELLKQLEELREIYDRGIISAENEKKLALQSLQLARQESQELLGKVKDYDDLMHKKHDATKSLQLQVEDNQELKDMLKNQMEENDNLKNDLASRDNTNSILLQEIQRLREINHFALDNISSLRDEKNQYKTSLDLTKKESGILKDKLNDFENITQQLQNLKLSHDRLINEKERLENELLEKNIELNRAIKTVQLTKKDSEELINKLQDTENTKNQMMKVNEAYQSEKHTLHQDLLERTRDADSLLESLNSLKNQNEELLQKCTNTDILEKQLKDLNRDYAKLLIEKNMLKSDFDNKTDEINNVYNMLECKIEENKHLLNQIKTLELHQIAANNNIKSLQSEQLTTQAALNLIKRESAELIDKIKYYEDLEAGFSKLKQEHYVMRIEKENLQRELTNQIADMQKMEEKNHELQNHSQNLTVHSEDLEKALISTRKELIKNSSNPDTSYKDIINEIERMKKENVQSVKRIRDLSNKLDESENRIANLTEDLIARDDRIAILENHKNSLEDEVRRLHGNLTKVVDVGEELQDLSYQKIEKCIQNMEAHHSRATHNMKIELAKLQHDNNRLEKQLSSTRLRSEESSRDKHKYISQIMELKNEREIIVTDIKQLEVTSVEDSALTPDNCDIEDVLESLDRIRKSLEAKGVSLEQTLLKVQTSSQLLLSKADEAKKIVEKEKQKIVNEKEEAVRDRQMIEKQLHDLKEKLESQAANDKAVINDLESEILNQKLIIDKLNQSTKDYITKLKEEMQSLQDLYENSMMKVSELQDKIKTVSEDKNMFLDMLKKTNIILEEKSKEVAVLQKTLEDFRNKQSYSIGVQVEKYILRHMETQTDALYNEIEHFANGNNVDKSILDQAKEINMLQVNEINSEKIHNDFKGKQMPETLNKVKVLTANIEPTFDYVRNSYLNYKIKRLGPGKLEHYSISCPSENESIEDYHDLSGLSNNLFSQSPNTSKGDKNDIQTQKLNLIDIYNKHSIHTNSSKGVVNTDVNVRLTTQNSQSPTKRDLEIDSSTDNKRSKSFGESTLGKSTDKDLFLIYKDSESDHTDNKYESKRPWALSGRSEIIVEAMTLHSREQENATNQSPRRNGRYSEKVTDKDPTNYYGNEEDKEDNSIKQKIKIDMPRVDVETSSLVTTSDGDKKSLDSYTMDIYSLTKRLSTSDIKVNDTRDNTNIKLETPSLPSMSNEDNQYLQLLTSIDTSHEKEAMRHGLKKTMKTVSPLIVTYHKASKQKYLTSKQKSKSPREKEQRDYYNGSHHKLSRVDADFLLLKSQHDGQAKDTRPREQINGNFGLKYILETVQHEVDPKNTYHMIRGPRKSRSDDRFNISQNDSITSPSRPSTFKISSTEYKTVSSVSKTSASQQKTFADRNVMAKIEGNEEYEDQIKHLTKTLENIEKDYKKKIDAIKTQYDSNIKSIINEHNEGVKSIQGLHEETLQDIIKLHENEVENLRSMSIEAMRKADKLEKENKALKIKTRECSSICLDQEAFKMATPEVKKRKKCKVDPKALTKTTIEAFNVKPKIRSHGPCTCSLDINLSDTIRNIFEQVDVEQRKMAEHTYMRYIANKIINGNIEALDAQELSFLHLKVCRIWKTKLTKEEALQKRIDTLESELMSKQRHAQQHMAELDRKVAEERRRLQEVRDAVCRGAPNDSRACSLDTDANYIPPAPPPTAAEKDFMFNCGCNTEVCNLNVGERRSAGDIAPGLSKRRARTETSRAVLAKLDVEERREKKLFNDEPPTRLRRPHERMPLRSNKK